MGTRITKMQVKQFCDTLNLHTGEAYGISFGSFGKVSMVDYVGSAEVDVLTHGHVSKRELLNRMGAYMAGWRNCRTKEVVNKCSASTFDMPYFRGGVRYQCKNTAFANEGGAAARKLCPQCAGNGCFTCSRRSLEAYNHPIMREPSDCEWEEPR